MSGKVLPWLLVAFVFLFNYWFQQAYDAVPHRARTLGGYLFLGVVFFLGARSWWRYIRGER